MTILEDFKVGDHVRWNSEAGPGPWDHPEKGYLGHELQGIHTSRDTGSAAVRHQK